MKFIITKEKIKNILIWSQKYTKTDMLYLAKGGSWLTTRVIVSSIITFILSIVFANALTKETLGLYKYILSIGAILAITAMPGMNTAVIQAIAKKSYINVQKVALNKIGFGLIGSMICLFLSWQNYTQHNLPISISFLIIALFLPFAESFTLYEAILTGKKKFRLSAIYNMLSHILSGIALLSTVLFFTKKVYILIFVYFFSWTLLRYIFLKKTTSAITPDSSNNNEILLFGKKMTFATSITILASHIDKIILFHFLGPTEVALYIIASAPIEQIKGLLKNIDKLSLPKFTRQTTQNIHENINLKTSKFVLFTIPIIFFYILLAPYFFKIFFPDYTASILLSQALAISLISVGSFLPYAAMKSKKASRQITQYNMVISGTQICLFVLGVYFWGLWGIIISRIISRVFNLFMSLYFVKKINPGI